MLCYSVGSLAAAAAQFFYTQNVAEKFGWSAATGWQRELGMFDLFLGLICGWAVWRNTSAVYRGVCGGICLISVLLAISHALSYQETGAIWHVQWGILNILALAGAELSRRLAAKTN